MERANKPAPMSRLRQERLRRGWSITRVVVLTEINATSLSLLERGLLPAFPGWKRRLADAFGMSVDELFPEAGSGTAA